MRKTGKKIADMLPVVGLGMLGRFVWAKTREITPRDRRWCGVEDNHFFGQKIEVRFLEDEEFSSDGRTARDRFYTGTQDLLQEHFGNEQKVASAYMNKALPWPQIKAEDVNALQEYSLFSQRLHNVMEEVQYMSDLDMPANMMTITKKLPYKWRTVACELQERHNCRVSFINPLMHKL